MQIITKTDITAVPLLGRGKVRDIYAVDADTLLIIATDRMSAFDVMMTEPIPYKGVVLNKITLFWMDRFKDIIPNHLLESDVRRFPEILAPWRDQLEGRAVLVKKAQALPLECIVRGCLTGSGWKDYLATGSVCGYRLPANLPESAKLEPALFTPSTKAELGRHDENITLAQAADILGKDALEQVRQASLRIFEAGREYAASRGILMADTKFEFGLVDGKLTLIDEVMTPDSSRFWPMDQYAPGRSQPSFDKQYLRDWLSAQPWNKQPPPPALPEEVVEATSRRYREAYTILTGETLSV